MAREYSSISVATTLNSGINTTATTMIVPSVGAATALLGGVTLDPGNVDIFTVAIDHDTVNEEIVFVTGVSGDTLTISRGQAGTGTPGVSGIAHNAGASIKHVLTSSDLIFYRDGVATADAAIPKSIIDAKGDIVTATAADTPARLAVGTTEHRLVAASAEATGLKYVADTTNYAVAAKGDLLVGTAADTLAPLTVGTNGQVLTADSTQATGLKWAAASSGALTKIVSTTFSAVSTQDFLGCFTSTYRTYKIVFANIISSTNADMQLKLYKSGNTLVGDYSGGVMQISTAGTPTAAFSNSYLTVFSFGKINSSAGNQYAGGEITLFNAQELIGPGYGTLSGITSWQSGGGASFRIGYYGSLNRDGNDSITGFQLLPSTGTISGTATVYGLEK